MGLAEKRWAQDRKKNDEPQFVSQVQAITGTKASVDIDWDGFSGNLDDSQYIVDKQYGLENLLTALKEVCSDDLGKDAIKGSLKKVVIKPAKSAAAKFAFEGGAIQWNAYFGSSSEGYVYKDAMKKTLEAAL
jgi:hypothetical protein